MLQAEASTSISPDVESCDEAGNPVPARIGVTSRLQCCTVYCIIIRMHTYHLSVTYGRKVTV